MYTSVHIYIHLYRCRYICVSQLAMWHLPALLVLEAKELQTVSSKSYVSFCISLVNIFQHLILREDDSYCYQFSHPILPERKFQLTLF